MKLALLLIPLLADAAGLIPVRSIANPACALAGTNTWLSAADGDRNIDATISQISAFIVKYRLEEAILRLESKPIEMISDTEAERFAGSEALNALKHNDKLRPYLVRAVFPAMQPDVKVLEQGSDLEVFAGGLGCAPFKRHPLVVLLERQPRHIVVGAASAL